MYGSPTQDALSKLATERSRLSENYEHRVDEARRHALEMLNEQRDECSRLQGEV